MLAVVAVKQMQDARRASAAEAAAIEKQINASIRQGDAIREAARAQLQPMVFAHAADVQTYDSTTEPDRFDQRRNEYMLSRGQVGFGYKLANEGTGLAINIRHGVEIAGRKFEYGAGMQFRALRPGERQPGDDFLDQGNWIRITPIAVVADERELPQNWEVQPRHYWAEFESIFGERFQTRNPNDPAEPAEFKAL